VAYEYYTSAGFCMKEKGNGTPAGFAEVILYNPSGRDAEVALTAYFADKAPHAFEPVRVRAGRNHLLVMPDMAPEVFGDCGHWGGRFTSTTPLVVEPIGSYSLWHETDTYKGGCPNFMGTKLHTQWRFADGLWIVQEHPDTSFWPFNELEHYYFLNPGPREAKLDIELQFRGIEHMRFNLTVPAERLIVWNNYRRIPYNQPYGMKVLSSEPVSASSIRFVYGMRGGFGEWGIQPHCAMPGIPGPVTQ
jgi:hypothetical protein